MAQQLIMDFVADLTRVVELRDPIVEFGSMQVEEGQPNDLRPLFDGREFVGTDMRSGPGVDRVEDLRRLSFADGEVGTAICLDTLEHCEDPLTAVREMHRVLADGGICVISSVMLFVIHGYPSDYWRFTPEGFRTLLAPFDDVWVAGIGDPEIPFQVVGVGGKGRELGISLEDFPSLARAQARWDQAEGKVRIGPFRMSPREIGGTLVRELPRALRQRAAARLRIRRAS
jgi:SAM-dependent methyltransferase